MPVNHGGLHLFSGHPLLVPGHDTGREFFVGNASTYVPGGVAGVDDPSHGDSPQRPFATLDYAIGQCTGGRGDVINVLPGHAEATITTTIAADVAGVKIRGLGVGQNRPTFTFTGTAGVLALSVANVEVTGLVFVAGVASHVRFLSLAGGADGAWLHHNLFREGSETGLSMVEWTGAADDVKIEDNAFYAPTAGNYDEAILIASTPTRGIIRRNIIYGNWDEGGINNATSNVATLFHIGENSVTNLLTNVGAIVLVSAVTGQLVNNRLFTDTQATALDPGAMGIAGNLWHAPGSDTEGVPPLAPLDSATSLIGVNDADNAASTSSVVSNRDGSIVERLEYLVDTAGDFLPGYGYKVTKVGDVASSPDDLFTITGLCEITRLVGQVTSAVATTTSLQLETSTGTVIIATSTQITTDAIGTLYTVTGDPDDALNGGSTPNDTIAFVKTGHVAPFVMDDDKIHQVIDGAGTGTIRWTLYYVPLEASAAVTSSA